MPEDEDNVVKDFLGEWLLEELGSEAAYEVVRETRIALFSHVAFCFWRHCFSRHAAVVAR